MEFILEMAEEVHFICRSYINVFHSSLIDFQNEVFFVPFSIRRNRLLNLFSSPLRYLTSSWWLYSLIKHLIFDMAFSIIVSYKWIGSEWKWRYPIWRNIVGHVKGCCNTFNDRSHTNLFLLSYSYFYYRHEPFWVLAWMIFPLFIRTTF